MATDIGGKMSIFRKLVTLGTTLVFTCIGATGAMAAGVSNRYICGPVSDWSCALEGYIGSDGPYGYDTFANDPATPGWDHNCTSYVAYRLYLYTNYHVEYNQLGDASEWATRAATSKYAALGVSVGQTAHANDVAQWTFSPGNGHVAWVDSVSSIGVVTLSISISEDMYGRKVTAQEQLIPGATGNNGWPDYFITFPGYIAPAPPPPPAPTPPPPPASGGGGGGGKGALLLDLVTPDPSNGEDS